MRALARLWAAGGEAGGGTVRYVWLAIAAALLGWGLTGLVLMAARRRQHVAQPSERGLHITPTPVGGGLGLIGAALLLWVLADWPVTSVMGKIAAAVAALAAVSWLDDRQPLPPAVRFAAQTLVVVGMMWVLPADTRLYQGVPIGVERAALALGWLWTLNLTNFMDGIDGLAGVEAVTVGLGYALLTYLFPSAGSIDIHLPDLALLLAAASSGYLIWNWAPAKIFMGDVGSIPLGFLFGLLMFDLALRGSWAAALVLPFYFIADATTTLLDRLRRGVKPWEAHREHAYQRAVLSGMDHATVVLHVAALNAGLIALAVLSVSAPWPALLGACALTAGLLIWLRSRVPVQ